MSQLEHKLVLSIWFKVSLKIKKQSKIKIKTT